MGQPDRSDERHDHGGDGEGLVTSGGLGPPGWDEFAAARARFMRTVAVAGLETAWAAPAHDPGGGEVQRP